MWRGTFAAAVFAAVCAGCTAVWIPGGVGGGCADVGGALPACTHPPTAPPGVSARDAAVAHARAAAGPAGATAEVVWAEVGNNWPSGRAHPWVWAVRLHGTGLAPRACPSGYLDTVHALDEPPCLDGDGGIIEILDAYTLEVLGTSH